MNVYRDELRQFAARNDDTLKRLEAGQVRLTQELERLAFRQDDVESVLRGVIAEVRQSLVSVAAPLEVPPAKTGSTPTAPLQQSVMLPLSSNQTKIEVDYEVAFSDFLAHHGVSGTSCVKNNGVFGLVSGGKLSTPLGQWTWGDWGVDMTRFGRKEIAVELRPLTPWTKPQPKDINLSSRERFADIREALVFARKYPAHMSEFNIAALAKPVACQLETHHWVTTRHAGVFRAAEGYSQRQTIAQDFYPVISRAVDTTTIQTGPTRIEWKALIAIEAK